MYKRRRTVRKYIDLTGQKFGRLLVLERGENSKEGKAQWKCKCDCGNEHTASSQNLKTGNTKSCGCYRKEILRASKHGMTGTRIYNIWFGMKQRCYYPKNRCYKTYGAEGVTVCEEWRHNFQAFYDWAMSHGYRGDLSIERIDNAKGYSPDNCRWATITEQANNKRNNRLITDNGETHSLAEWAEITGLNRVTIAYRLKANWDIEKALSTPTKQVRFLF